MWLFIQAGLVKSQSVYIRDISVLVLCFLQSIDFHEHMCERFQHKNRFDHKKYLQTGYEIDVLSRKRNTLRKKTSVLYLRRTDKTKKINKSIKNMIRPRMIRLADYYCDSVRFYACNREISAERERERERWCNLVCKLFFVFFFHLFVSNFLNRLNFMLGHF